MAEGNGQLAETIWSRYLLAAVTKNAPAVSRIVVAVSAAFSILANSPLFFSLFDIFGSSRRMFVVDARHLTTIGAIGG